MCQQRPLSRSMARLADSREVQRRISLGLACRFAWLEGQLPPRVSLGKQGIHVCLWPHPRRVAELQVEAAACEDRCEVEFPVEESLLAGDLSQTRSQGWPSSTSSTSLPRRSQRLRSSAYVQVLPVGGLVSAASCPGCSCAPRARRPRSCLACLDPLVEGGRARAASVCERPEPERGPGVHDPPEALVRAVRLAQGLLDLLTGDSLRVAWILLAPQRDVTPGLRLRRSAVGAASAATGTRPGGPVRPAR